MRLKLISRTRIWLRWQQNQCSCSPARRSRVAHRRWLWQSQETCTVSATSRPTCLLLGAESRVQPESPKSPGTEKDKGEFLKTVSIKRKRKLNNVCLHFRKKIPGAASESEPQIPYEAFEGFLRRWGKTAGKLLHVYLLRWCDALLFVELGALFGFAVQAEALFKGLLLQHQSGAEPEVVCLSQVLQHTWADGNRRNALGHGFHKAVQGTGLAIPLSQVAAAAQERTHFPWQSLKKQRYTAYHTNHLHLTTN